MLKKASGQKGKDEKAQVITLIYSNKRLRIILLKEEILSLNGPNLISENRS